MKPVSQKKKLKLSKMITPENLVKHELIGLKIEVAKSSNKTNIGLSGLVVNETKNILFIEAKGGLKKIQKKGTELIFTLPNGKRVRVEGNLICKRPEDRLKIKVKKW